MKTKFLVLIMLLAFAFNTIAQVRPSELSPATVAALKTKLQIQTQAQADLRYPRLSNLTTGLILDWATATTAFVTGTPWPAMNYVTGTPWTAMGYVTGTPWTVMGYLTSYNEIDPNIYSWAKAGTKPTYTASEVGLGNVTNESKATMFTNPTFTTGITTPAITLGVTALTPSGAELNYVDNVTSPIQTQLNAKVDTLINTEQLTKYVFTKAQVAFKLDSVRNAVQIGTINQVYVLPSPLAHTGATTETTLLTTTLPAGLVSATGSFHIYGMVSFNSSTNFKTCKVKFNGTTVALFTNNGQVGLGEKGYAVLDMTGSVSSMTFADPTVQSSASFGLTLTNAHNINVNINTAATITMTITGNTPTSAADNITLQSLRIIRYY